MNEFHKCLDSDEGRVSELEKRDKEIPQVEYYADHVFDFMILLTF